jgi:hydrogenase/urease accessory protein HupE
MKITIHTALAILLFASFTVYTGRAGAHSIESSFIQVDIIKESFKTYAVKWSASDYGIKVVFPSECYNSPAGITDGPDTVFICKSSADNLTIRFLGMKNISRDLLVRFIDEEKRDAKNIKVVMLNWQNNSFTIKGEEPLFKVAAFYFDFGVKHIFTGLDHLLFILALLLVISGFRRLIATITAFTVAHSITLALATFNILKIPRAPVEAVIALSILFLAVEYTKQQQKIAGWTTHKPWLVSFAVGLLHGLGFAEALTSLGLSKSDIPIALFTFNVGVEAGQLIFIVTVMLLVRMVATLVPRIPSWTKTALAYIIGSSAGLWFVQRTIGFMNL